MKQVRGVLNHRDSPCRVFRNNNGFDEGRQIKYGLGKGSPDLVGFTRTGQFLGVEVKTLKGRVSPEQKVWIALITEFGGLAIVIRSVAEAEALVEKLRAV